MREVEEEEDFIPLLFSPPSFFESPKKTMIKTPHLPKL
jgi:hypothetical protein